MNKYEIVEQFNMQDEVQTFLLHKGCERQIKALPQDFVFDLMLKVGMGTWFNVLCEVLRDTDVKLHWETD